MRSLELLAPAKNIECGMAAISHGADAVYIGASRFSARAAAGNSVEDIKTLCDFAHQFGAKPLTTQGEQQFILVKGSATRTETAAYIEQCWEAFPSAYAIRPM